MRPLIKPYMPLLDWALENVTTVGDFVILVLSLPFKMFWSWWKPSDAGMETMVIDEDEDTPESVDVGMEESQPGRPSQSRVSSNGSDVQLRMRGSRLPSDSSSRNSVAGPSRISRPNGVPASRSDTTVNQVRGNANTI